MVTVNSCIMMQILCLCTIWIFLYVLSLNIVHTYFLQILCLYIICKVKKIRANIELKLKTKAFLQLSQKRSPPPIIWYVTMKAIHANTSIKFHSLKVIGIHGGHNIEFKGKRKEEQPKERKGLPWSLNVAWRC